MADELRQVQNFVSHRVKELTNSKNDPWVRATLAELRRGIGKPPGSVPQLWNVTLSGMPEELYSRDGTPTRGEWAAYIALTMFALHQQGKDTLKQSMNAEGVSLGTAVKRLVRSDEGEERVKRRFDSAITSDSPEELAHHLRGLVQLLRSEDIPLDYGRLAADLYLFFTDSTRDKVKLRWGQDFYRYSKQEDGDELPEKE